MGVVKIGHSSIQAHSCFLIVLVGHMNAPANLSSHSFEALQHRKGNGINSFMSRMKLA